MCGEGNRALWAKGFRVRGAGRCVVKETEPCGRKIPAFAGPGAFSAAVGVVILKIRGAWRCAARGTKPEGRRCIAGRRALRGFLRRVSACRAESGGGDAFPPYRPLRTARGVFPYTRAFHNPLKVKKPPLPCSAQTHGAWKYHRIVYGNLYILSVYPKGKALPAPSVLRRKRRGRFKLRSAPCRSLAIASL